MLGRNVWVHSDEEATQIRLQSRAVVLTYVVAGAALMWVGVVMAASLGVANIGTYILFLPITLYGLFQIIRGLQIGVYLNVDGTVTEVGLFKSRELRVQDIVAFRVDRDPSHPLPWHAVWVDQVGGLTSPFDELKVMRFSGSSVDPLQRAASRMNDYIDGVR